MKTKKRRFIPNEVFELADVMGIECPQAHELWTIECGLHSGFPYCCIIFFTMVWKPMMHELYDNDGYFVSTSEIYNNYRRMLDSYKDKNGHIGYVPCPACFLERNFVKVKQCDCRRKRTYPLLHDVKT